MPSNTREIIGWILAFAGLAFGVAAAYVKGGLFESLTAASVGFTGLSAAFGYISKSPTNKV